MGGPDGAAGEAFRELRPLCSVLLLQDNAGSLVEVWFPPPAAPRVAGGRNEGGRDRRGVQFKEDVDSFLMRSSWLLAEAGEGRRESEVEQG